MVDSWLLIIYLFQPYPAIRRSPPAANQLQPSWHLLRLLFLEDCKGRTINDA